MIYETTDYCEFKMMDAVEELNKNPFRTFLEVAEEFEVPVPELQKEYVANRAKGLSDASI